MVTRLSDFEVAGTPLPVPCQDTLDDLRTWAGCTQRIAKHARKPDLADSPVSVLEPRVQWFDTPGRRQGELLARPVDGTAPETFFRLLSVPEHREVLVWQARIAAGLAGAYDALVSVNLPNTLAGTARDREALIAFAASLSHPVCFEFTEEHPLPAAAVMNPLLDRLAALGCPTALDDFGDGFHVAAGILSEYRFSTVKISRRYMLACFAARDPLARLVPIRDGAARRGQDVIVEGVDDPVMLAVLRGAGFTIFQSFLYHRPETVPAALSAR